MFRKDLLKVGLAVVTHASLMIMATVCFLISLAILPISYCAVALHTTSCLCTNAYWAINACFGSKKLRRGEFTMDGAIVAILSMLVQGCAIALLYVPLPEPNSKFGNETKDPLIALLIGNITSPNAKYYMGLLTAVLAGVSFSLGHSLSKSKTLTEDSVVASKNLKT